MTPEDLDKLAAFPSGPPPRDYWLEGCVRRCMTPKGGKVKVEDDIAIPDGWEFDRIDQAFEGDHVLMPGGLVDLWDRDKPSDYLCVILRKKPEPKPLKWPEWANDPAWDWMQAMALDPEGNSFTLWGYSTKELSYDAGEQMWVTAMENDGSFRFPWLLIDIIYPPDIKPEDSLIVRPTASRDAKHVTGHVATDYNPT